MIISTGMIATAKTLPMAYPLLNVGPEQSYVDQALDQSTLSADLRSYFPETWLWELVSTGCAYLH
jgi:hypothetical protein